MAQACRVQQFPFSENQEVRDLDWELYLRETAQQIVKEQNPRCVGSMQSARLWKFQSRFSSVRQLLEVRSRLYELLTHCIPADTIFV